MSKNSGLLMKNFTPEMLNNRTYWDLFYRLKNLAINMFEWENLPDTIDPRYIEERLFDLGYVCFFKDDITKENQVPEFNDNDTNVPYFALQCTIGGKFNVYNLPTEYHIVTPNGYTAKRDASNSVIIFNNFIHQPTINTIELYAYRLMEAQRTIDVNLTNQRHPFIILAPESQRLSIKNLLLNVKSFNDLIVASDNLDINQFKVLDLNAPDNVSEIQIFKKQLWNEVLTFLGINNANQDKKERLISDEVTSNLEEIVLQRQAMLNARQQACDMINQMFGLNISVKFRELDMSMYKDNDTEPDNASDEEKPEENENKEVE